MSTTTNNHHNQQQHNNSYSSRNNNSPQGEIIVWYWPTSTPLFIAQTNHHALSVTFSNNGSMIIATVGKEIYIYPYLLLHYSNILSKTIQYANEPLLLQRRNRSFVVDTDVMHNNNNDNDYYYSLLQSTPEEAFTNPSLCKGVCQYLLDQCVRNHHYAQIMKEMQNTSVGLSRSTLSGTITSPSCSQPDETFPTPDRMLPLFTLDCVIRSINMVSNVTIDQMEDHPILSSYISSTLPDYYDSTSKDNDGDSLSYLIAALEKPAQLNQKSSSSTHQTKDSAGPVIMWLFNEYGLNRCLYAYHNDCKTLMNQEPLMDETTIPTTVNPSSLSSSSFSSTHGGSPTDVWKSTYSKFSSSSTVSNLSFSSSSSMMDTRQGTNNIPFWKPVSYTHSSSSAGSTLPYPSHVTVEKDTNKGSGIYNGPPSLPPGQPWRIPLIPPSLAYETAKRLANEFGDYIALNCTENNCSCGWCKINPDFLSSSSPTPNNSTIEDISLGIEIETNNTVPSTGVSDTDIHKHPRRSIGSIGEESKNSMKDSVTNENLTKYSLLVSILYDLIMRDTDEMNRKVCYYERIFDVPPWCVVGPILLSRGAVVFNDNGLSISTRASLEPSVSILQDNVLTIPSSVRNSSSLILATVSSPPNNIPTNSGKWGIPTEPMVYHHIHPDVYTPSVFGYASSRGCNCSKTDKIGCSYETIRNNVYTVPVPATTQSNNKTVSTPSESLRYEYARAIHALVARIAPTAPPTKPMVNMVPSLLVTKSSIRYHGNNNNLSMDHNNCAFPEYVSVTPKRKSSHGTESHTRHQRLWSITSNDSLSNNSNHPYGISSRSPAVSFSSMTTNSNSVVTHRRPYSYSTSSSHSDSTNSRLSIVPVHNTTTNSDVSLVSTQSTTDGNKISPPGPDDYGNVSMESGKDSQLPSNPNTTSLVSASNVAKPSTPAPSTASSLFSPLLRSLFGVKTSTPNVSSSSSETTPPLPSTNSVINNATVPKTTGNVPSIELSSHDKISSPPSMSRPPSSPVPRTVSRSSFSTGNNNPNHSPGGNRKRSFADHESVLSCNSEDMNILSNSPVLTGMLVSSSTPLPLDSTTRRSSMNSPYTTPEGYSVRRTSFNTTVSNGSVYRGRGDTHTSMTSIVAPPVLPVPSTFSSHATLSGNLTNYSSIMVSSPLNPSLLNTARSPRGSFASHSHPRSSFGGSFSGSVSKNGNSLTMGGGDHASERLRSISSVAALAAAAMEGLVLDDIEEEDGGMMVVGGGGGTDVTIKKNDYSERGYDYGKSEYESSYTDIAVNDDDENNNHHPFDSSFLELWCGIVHVSLWQRLLIWTGVPDPIHDMVHGKDDKRINASGSSNHVGIGTNISSTNTSMVPYESNNGTHGLPVAGILRVQHIRIPPLAGLQHHSASSSSYSLPYLPCHFGRSLCQYRTENIIANSVSSIQIAPYGGHVLLGIEPSLIPVVVPSVPEPTTVTDSMYNHVLIGTAQLSLNGAKNNAGSNGSNEQSAAILLSTPTNPPNLSSFPSTSSTAVVNRTILRSIRLDNGQSSLEITAPTTAVNTVAWNPLPTGRMMEKGNKRNYLWGFIYGTQRGQIRRVAAAANVVQKE